MKTVLINAIIILCVVSTHAQKITKGSFNVLANEKTVIVKIDYTESEIDKVPFEAFLESVEDWDKGYHEIILKFVKAANQTGSGIIYSAKKTDNYQLVFKAKKVTRYGHTTGSLFLLDKEDNVIGVAEKFEVEGGLYGSQMNLMGDASERLGKVVARFIKKAINRKQ